ncbi:hypothetical protein GCM10020220_078430 [Nonomuraea rubra]|uniref:hypothetical protein n=1 Tax=Nonomuraea rubra TaxID=46180 RepID=UPI0031EDB0FD
MTKIAAVAAAVAVVALPAAPAAADGAPDERPDVSVGTWLAARTQPAVQLTSFTYTGTVAVPTSTINETTFNALTQQAVDAVQAGKISSDERSIAKWLFQRIAADVDTYLTETTPERTVEAEVGGLCTGWWVTPDGYMVTGAHCVQVGETELSQLFAQQALAKFNEQDAKEIIAGLQGIEADEEILKLAQQIYVTFNTGHMKIRNLQQSLSVLQSLPGGGVDKTAKATPAELVSVGESYPGKDFAAAQGQRPAEPADRPARRRRRRAHRRHAVHQRLPRPGDEHAVLQPGVEAGARSDRGAVQRQAHHPDRRAVHPRPRRRPTRATPAARCSARTARSSAC